MKNYNPHFLSHQKFKSLLFLLSGVTVFLLYFTLEGGNTTLRFLFFIALFLCVSVIIFYLHINIWKPLYYFNIKLAQSSDSTLKYVNQLKDYRIDAAGFVIHNSLAVIEDLSENVQNATKFIEDIEQGKLDTKYKGYDSDKENSNSLAKALLSMREQMQLITEKEKQRTWITEGLAKFADILRHSNMEAENLYDNILINVVKYIQANQGGLYIIKDYPDGEKYFELVSFCAYNRKKYLTKTYHIREGLLGQSYFEKDIIFLTDVPKDYVSITSGVGEALPTCILVVPLKINEEIIGAIEIAAFSTLETYRIDFLVKLAENIASSISSIQISQKTSHLLEESRIQAEQMRNQEEELLQNLEELNATQEEIMRNEKGHLNEINRLRQLHEDSLQEAHKQTLELQKSQEETQKLMEEIQTSQESITKNYHILFERFNSFNIESKFDQLTAIRSTKKRNIEDYFNGIRNQILTYSEDKMIVDAMKAFKQAFAEVGSGLSEEEIESMRNNVREYYENEYLPRLNVNKDEPESIEKYWETDPKTIYMQYHYISHNENETGKKHLLNTPEDGSKYAELHATYHPIIRNFLLTFGYYDIFLVDNETGHIIYSVFKEVDYTTSLLSGPYKNTNFAQVFREARNAKDKELIKLVDFEPYDPSYTAPASFIATPIFDGENKIGVLVFQMPIDKINFIMTGDKKWKEDGLGASGETYLVGEDYKMRSMSRFLIEDPVGYFNELDRMGYNERIQKKIKQLNTTILLQDVKTDAVIDALRGNTDKKIVLDYRGISVLSAYSRLNIQDVNWVICSDIDEAEVLESISYLKEMQETN